MQRVIKLNKKNELNKLLTNHINLVTENSIKPEYTCTIVHKFIEADNLNNKFIKNMLSYQK